MCSVEQVAEYSPLLALAKAWKRPMVPILYNVIGSFTSAQPSQTQTLSWQASGAQTRVSSFIVVDAVMFEIDVPSANAGSVWKPISDFFFGLQSGVTAQMLVVGGPQYPVAPDFSTPIRSLCAMLNEGWPQGWVLTYQQSIMMQFLASVALPYLPTTITVSFRAWQPQALPTNCADVLQQQYSFQGMDNGTALDILEKLGYDVKCRDPNAPQAP
jgi:hypothetical protein